MIGETLGNYRIVSKIGKGGMGAVYLAEHAMMARRAAIKVLLPAFSHQPAVVRRFFNEARASARLQHPALVAIYDCGHHQPTGSAYLVMDYLEGESLSRRLRQVGRLPVGLAITFAREIAAGMAVAHQGGIIHRDLKPGNVFLVPDRERGGDSVRILDFGVAKLSLLEGPAAAMTGAGMVLGTPSYMAPEQGRGATTIDGRADVYALGCILFAMLCGRPPFTYKGAGELLAAHAHEKPPAPRILEPSIPAALEREILKALAKDPGARHADMLQLSAALGAVAVPRGSTEVLPILTTAGVPMGERAGRAAPAGRPAAVTGPAVPAAFRESVAGWVPARTSPEPVTPRATPSPRAMRAAPQRPIAGTLPARPREAESTFGGAAAAITRTHAPRARGRTLAMTLAAVLSVSSATALWRGLAPESPSAADAGASTLSIAGSGPEWTPLPPRPALPRPTPAPPAAPPPTLHPEPPTTDDRAAPPRRAKPRKKRHRPAPLTPERVPPPEPTFDQSAPEGAAEAPQAPSHIRPPNSRPAILE